MADFRKSAGDYEKYVQEKTSEALHLLNDTNKSVLSVFTPDLYTTFLNIVNKFHWYSYINNLLILYQFPQAEYLSGYDVWKKVSLSEWNDPNRQILKQSQRGKGIRLIAPFTKVEGDVRSLVNFVVPVYDINQTNNIPLPESNFVDLSRCSCSDIINAINFVAPYRTVLAASEDKVLSHDIKGYCNHQMQLFVLDGRLPIRGMLSALLHEYAVAELFICGYKNQNLSGLIVESVFYILCNHFKLQTDNITFSYVSKYRDENPQDVIYALYLIQTIVHKIIEKVEEHLEYMIALDPSNDLLVDEHFYDNVNYLEGVFNEV